MHLPPPAGGEVRRDEGRHFRTGIIVISIQDHTWEGDFLFPGENGESVRLGWGETGLPNAVLEIRPTFFFFLRGPAYILDRLQITKVLHAIPGSTL
jgi:hypothetical protein